jgi:phosphate transport system substrate-binding protein
MSNSLKIIVVCMVVLVAFAMCKRKPSKVQENDTAISGSAKMLADESFRPILEQEQYVFKSLYPNTKPELIYKTEAEAIKLLMSDSIRTAILARELSAGEVKLLTARTLPPEITPFAHDAVAIIVNQQSNDTLITVDELKQLLNGKVMTDKNVVFDNPNSSLVRYLKELSGNGQLKQKNIYALNTNKDVITYVSEHENAIGIVGFNWLNEPDADYASAAAKVKTVAVKGNNDKASTQYFKPSQATLALKQYPLSRNLYYINCTGREGLATAFADFLHSDRGQRIILKSGLLPDSIPSREINIVK